MAVIQPHALGGKTIYVWGVVKAAPVSANCMRCMII